jgi:hypothetical protein
VQGSVDRDQWQVVEEGPHGIGDLTLADYEAAPLALNEVTPPR